MQLHTLTVRIHCPPQGSEDARMEMEVHLLKNVLPKVKRAIRTILEEEGGAQMLTIFEATFEEGA